MVTKEQFDAPYTNLKFIIRKHGFTQDEFSKRINMDRSVFNVKINRNNGRDFSLSEAFRMSELLDEKVDNFFSV